MKVSESFIVDVWMYKFSHKTSTDLVKNHDLTVFESLNIKRRGIEIPKESMYVGRGTPEFTPVEIGSIPEMANPVVETGSPRL
jgi:hypothetical protein